MLGTNLLPHVIQPVASVVEVDDYGNSVRVPGVPGAEVRAYVQPLATTEDSTEGQVRESRYKVFVSPGLEDLDAWSHIVWQGRHYECLGDPRRHETPEGPHHVTVLVRRVGA